jgi:hypothetical protein
MLELFGDVVEYMLIYLSILISFYFRYTTNCILFFIHSNILNKLDFIDGTSHNSYTLINLLNYYLRLNY